MNYIIVSVACVLGLTIEILSLLENELFSSRRKKQFIILATIIIFEIIIDTFSMQMDGKKWTPITVFKILKIVEFIITPIIPTFLAKIVTFKGFWQNIRKKFYALISINGILQVLTFFMPIMFRIDENAVYSRTPFTFVYMFILIMCFALLMISARNTFTQNTSRYGCTLFTINMFLLIGILMRMYFSKTNVDWLCVTIGYFIFVVYFCNSYLKVDSLTSLLNQRAFYNKLSQINYSTALIVIDANNFKLINDTHGHQSGDWALAKFAELIFNTYSKVGYCYRIGGDEFCVILKPQMLKKLAYGSSDCDTYRMLFNLMNNLDKAITELTKTHSLLKYGVSQGFGIYYSSLDNPSIDEYKTIEEVLKIADERMYQKKRKAKRAGPNNPAFN